MPRQTTYYAVVVDGVVLGSRESISRHVGGTGRFAPYTHAVIAKASSAPDYVVISYHGSQHLASAAAGPWLNRYVSVLVVPVDITPKKLQVTR